MYALAPQVPRFPFSTLPSMAPRTATPVRCQQCGCVLWDSDLSCIFTEHKRKLQACLDCAKDMLARRASSDDLVAAELEDVWRLPAWRIGISDDATTGTP